MNDCCHQLFSHSKNFDLSFLSQRSPSMRKVRRELKEMHEFIHWLAFRKVTGDVMGIVYKIFFFCELCAYLASSALNQRIFALNVIKSKRLQNKKKDLSPLFHYISSLISGSVSMDFRKG